MPSSRRWGETSLLNMQSLAHTERCVKGAAKWRECKLCLIWLRAGHQSVQSQVQPKYQHDQKVHRSAHRQAVHWAKPDLGRRVQLRGVRKLKEHRIHAQWAVRGQKSWTCSSSSSESPRWLKAGLVPPFLKTRNITVSRQTPSPTPPPSSDSTSSWFWSCLHHQCHARVRSTTKKC